MLFLKELWSNNELQDVFIDRNYGVFCLRKERCISNCRCRCGLNQNYDWTIGHSYALRWQKNTCDKWRETGQIHAIREKMHCGVFGCQNQNANHFYRIQRYHLELNADRLLMRTAMITLILKHKFDLKKIGLHNIHIYVTLEHKSSHK